MKNCHVYTATFWLVTLTKRKLAETFHPQSGIGPNFWAWVHQLCLVSCLDCCPFSRHRQKSVSFPQWKLNFSLLSSLFVSTRPLWVFFCEAEEEEWNVRCLSNMCRNSWAAPQWTSCLEPKCSFKLLQCLLFSLVLKCSLHFFCQFSASEKLMQSSFCLQLTKQWGEAFWNVSHYQQIWAHPFFSSVLFLHCSFQTFPPSLHAETRSHGPVCAHCPGIPENESWARGPWGVCGG